MKTNLRGCKLILALTFFLGNFYQSFAQTTEWVIGMGGNGAEFGQVIAIDAAGNSYAAGQFQGTADFDPGNGVTTLVSSGNYDVFIAKYSPTSDLIWARKVGGSLMDVVNSIAVDTGYVYITGTFLSTVDFDPGPLTDNLVSVGATDIYVLKLNTAGDYVWAKRMGGTAPDVGRSIAVDTLGNVYTTGSFQNTADFDPSTITASNLVSLGAQDVFVSKLSPLGDFVWVKQMGGLSVETGYGITLDASNNLFVAGSFADSCNFNTSGGTTNLYSLGLSDAFIVALDPLGDFVWATSFGDTTDEGGRCVNVDAAGNVYVAGFMNNSTEIFLNKYDALGVLASSVNSTNLGSPQSFIELHAFRMDAMGNAYLAGAFAGTMDLDLSLAGSQSVTSTSNNTPDGYILKMDPSGALTWMQHIAPTIAIAFGLAVDKQTGTLFATGGFAGSNTNFGGLFLSPSSPAPDAYVLKIDNPILSVKMGKLKGEISTDGRSHLSWETFSEKDNEGFYIERSVNGKDFSFLGRVSSGSSDGNSASPTAYRFIDPTPLKQSTYYRLYQKDRNGKVIYSNTIFLDPKRTSGTAITISPNPITDKVSIQKPNSFNNATIKILNTTGRLVKRYSNVTGTTFQMDLGELVSGAYFLITEENGISQRISLIKR